MLDKLLTEDEKRKMIQEVMEDLGLKTITAIKHEDSKFDLNDAVDKLAQVYKKKDLERVLKENGNGDS